MGEPKWITREEVEFFHKAGLEMAGGLQGLRDASLLDSALARPKNHYAYGERDVFQLAACYAEGFNHTFHDGNKRVAFACAGSFLQKNGYDLQPSKGDSHADMMVKLVEKEINREDIAQYFKDNCRTIEQEKSTTQEEPPKKDWNKTDSANASVEKPKDWSKRGERSSDTIKRAPMLRGEPNRSR